MAVPARILIVEDDAVLMIDLQDTITRLGYHLAGAAATGMKAVELALVQKPDVILMDIKLRGSMNGIQAAEKIRTQQDIPIIYLTAYTDDSFLQQAKLTDAYAYLTKPVRERELRASLETAIYKHSSEQRLRHINQVLRAVRDVNQLITRERDPQHLMVEACKILLHTRDYLFVWIGQPAGNLLQPSARAGEDQELLNTILATATPESGSKLPGTVAARTRQVVLCGDMLTDERYQPWQEEVKKSNFKSTVTIPMLYEDTLMGVLVVYAGQINFFDEEELGLLSELAGDIAFGLKAITQEAERKRAEESLRRSEAHFRAVVENSYDGVILMGVDRKALYVSPSYTRINGFSPEEWVGAYVPDFIRPEDREYVAEAFEMLLMEPDIPVTLEFRLHHKGGHWFWVETTATNMLSDPHLEAVVLNSRDINLRKLADDALSEANSRLETLINVSPLALFLLDMQGRVQLWNPAAEGMFGWSAKEVLGKPNPIIPSERQEEYNRLSTQVLGGSPMFNQEVVRQRKDGSYIDVSISSAPFYDQAGKPVGRMAIIADITERKLAEQALQQRNTELSAINQVGQTLSKLAGPEEILETVFNMIGQVLDNQNLFIALYDHANEYITFPIYTIDGKRMDGSGRRLANGITDFVIRNNAPFFVKDDLLSSLKQHGIDLIGTVSRSFLAVPLRLDNKVMGVIAIQDYQKASAYQEHHLEMLTTMAAQTSIALENSRLFDAMQRELTERKLAEEALRDSEEKFARAFQNAPVLMGITEIETGNFIDINEEALRVSGYSREEVIGHNAVEIGWMTEADRQRLINGIKSHDNIEGIEINFHKKDGSHLLGLVKGDKVTIRGREYNLTVSVDLTERILAQAAVIESQEQLQAVVQTASDAIITLNKERLISYWNDAAQKMFGYSASEMIGKPMSQIIPSKYRASAVDGSRQALENGSLRNQGKPLEATALNKENKEFPVEISFANWETSAGRFVTAILRDITERKQHENELQAIATVSAALRTAQNRKEMQPVILGQLSQLLKCDSVVMEIIDPVTGNSTAEAALGTWQTIIGYSQKVGTGLNAIIAEHRRAYLDNHISENSRIDIPGNLLEGIIAVAGAPLLAQNQLIGFLWMGRKTEIAESEVRLLTSVADIAANAIHRATLHEQTRKDAANLALAYGTTLEGWAHALEMRDQETEGHTRRVVQLTLDLARNFGIGEDRLEYVRRGALLHDIGKMGIPDSILLKPGTLGEREWEIMHRHPEYALQLLEPIEFLHPSLEIPYCHHEKWDGSGYPRGLSGKEIPLEARIFAIVDVWDALRSNRPYRIAWPDERIYGYLRSQAGKHFDPDVVNSFFELVVKNDGGKSAPVIKTS